MRLTRLTFLLLAAFASCTRVDTVDSTTRLVVVGDSILAWHSGRGRSIADVVQAETGLATSNLSLPGARISHSNPKKAVEGYDIRRQYKSGPWEWVLINGGANDLLSECGCSQCDDNLNTLISADGRSGEIPALVNAIRTDGPKVMILGYYDSNDLPNVFTGCSDEVDVLNARLAVMASMVSGVYYTTAEDVIDPGNGSHWFPDRVHPSQKASRLIGQHVARAILKQM